MSKKAFAGLLVLAVLLVLLVLFLGNLIWGETWRVPPEFQYDILKDTLTIVLAVLAVGIAVIGYALYLALSGLLQRESMNASRIEVTRGAARVYTHLGFIFWQTYESNRNEIHYLDMAITLTERGHDFIDELPERMMQDRENDLLLCTTRNNLAYYLAERRLPKDKPLAKKYCEFLRKKAPNYREQTAAWLDTCEFVDRQYQY